jgi:methionyl-tRNA formyltransferase
MKVLFFCDDREGARAALKIAIEKDIIIVGCVTESYTEQLAGFCKENSIVLYNMNDINQMMHKGELPSFDYAISYLYSEIIKKDLIQYVGEEKMINFHPAPVQIHKGIGACCYCLLNGYKRWGVTAHYIAPHVDEGDIIKQRYFDVDDNITAIELEEKEQEEQLKLFSEIMDMLNSGEVLPRIKQEENTGHHYSRKQLLEDKDVSMSDSAEEIDKKINALWFPPYHGASIVIDGKRYSLVNDEILNKLAMLYSKK